MTDAAIDEHAKLAQTQSVVQIVESLLQSIRFGSIELVVHDGRIVQIEKHEKFRLNHPV